MEHSHQVTVGEQPSSRLVLLVGFAVIAVLVACVYYLVPLLVEYSRDLVANIRYEIPGPVRY